MSTEPAHDETVPAAFLPPPKRKRKCFVDQPLLEASEGGLSRSERLEAYQEEAYPDGPPEPPDWWAKRPGRRRWR